LRKKASISDNYETFEVKKGEIKLQQIWLENKIYRQSQETVHPILVVKIFADSIDF
jgi:hypothetical protein